MEELSHPTYSPVVSHDFVLIAEYQEFLVFIIRPQQIYAAGKRRPERTIMSPIHINLNILAKLPVSLENLTLSILHGHGYSTTKYWAANRQLRGFGDGAGGALSSLERFRQLRLLRASAYLVLGDPLLSRDGEQLLRSWQGEVWQREGKYTSRYLGSQVAAFYKYLPSCIEVLILEDCEKPVGGFMKQFLEMRFADDTFAARHIRLRRVEIKLRYPRPTAKWSYGITEEEVLEEDWVAGDELRELGKRMCIVVVQSVKDNYRGFPD